MAASPDLNVVLDLAKTQLQWQQGAYDAIDTKAMGLLAFDGALTAAVLAIKPTNGLLGVVGVALLVTSAGLCVAAHWTRHIDLGPRTLTLYRELEEDNALAELDAQVFIHLDDAFAANTVSMRRKRGLWRAGALALVGAMAFMTLGIVV